MRLRPYQAEGLDELWAWMHAHAEGNPIVEASVGAGKSLMIAAVAQRADLEAPGTRVLVLVHQKELLEQNLDKLQRIWPGCDVGIVSASRGRKQLTHQITYATIGSIYKLALQLGRIDIVMADECHLINPKEEGMWRTFLKDLSRTCPQARVIGWTGTPFRGNGVWLTGAEKPMFQHVATRITMTKLLELGYLAPLVPAITKTRVSSDGVRTSGDDYVVSELAKVTDTEALVEATCDEIVELGKDRKSWLVFAVTLAHAEHVRDALRERGVVAEMVSGETPKVERERLIASYQAGTTRCLVNVGVLTTGFDAPATDAIFLLRATKSPVFYVQIAGRGMRCLGADIHESRANGKADCLWADFTSTTVELGPVDQVHGRPPAPRSGGPAPHKYCPQCTSVNAAGATECSSCKFKFPEPERVKHSDTANGAQVLSSGPTRNDKRVTDVHYSTHTKEGSADTMRVEYMDGLKVVAREWVCFNHAGYPRRKAEAWWAQRSKYPPPPDVKSAIEYASGGGLREPDGLIMKTGGDYPEIIGYNWRAA